MEKEIVLEDEWDPDKYRDELCERAWKDSGATTLEEFIQYSREKQRKLMERLNAEAQKKKVVS